MQPIIFCSADKLFNYKNKRFLKKFITSLFSKENKPLLQLSYVFCSDDYLLHINQTFLQHDDYTDIITFDLSKDKLIEGEIYISIDRVKDNAQQWKVSFQEEMLRVILHGALHLCGYDDKKPKEKITMRAKENFYINLYHHNQLV